MAKEKNYNPVAAHKKSVKKSQIKKSKSTLSAARAEKLSKRNPKRIEDQIEALNQSKEKNGGVLKPREKEVLEKLERELGAIRKAKERLGIEDEPRRDNFRSDQGGNILGKRRRDNETNDGRGRHNKRGNDSSDTDEDVKNIPMPKDIENMPPIPRKRKFEFNKSSDNSSEPLIKKQAQTVYSSAPQIRDLQKEAVSKFIPNSVAKKISAIKGKSGKLLEPEELDALEKAGYNTGLGNYTDDIQNDKQVVQNDKHNVQNDIDHIVEEAEKELEFRLMNQEKEFDKLNSEEKKFRMEMEISKVENNDDEDDNDDDNNKNSYTANNKREREVDDIEKSIVNEAEEELHYRLMMEENLKGEAKSEHEQSKRFQKNLKHVEIEDISDEDL